MLFCLLYIQIYDFAFLPFLSPSSHPPLLCFFVCCVCDCLSMPPLRLTRQQIVERTRREIRLRTEARQAQLRQLVLHREEGIAKDSDEEDSEDEGPPPCEVGLRRQAHWSVCVNLICFLLLLLLLLCLNRLYHAKNKTNNTI